MREIKFRAYDNVLKIMMPDFDNWLDFNGNYWTSPDKCYDTPNQEIVRGHNYIIMQFTGLHDKNGKEIYEGDIVRIDKCECTGHDDNGSETWIDCEGEVLFEDGMFVFEGHSAGTLPMSAYKDDFEVIGNIYQNPDLLK